MRFLHENQLTIPLYHGTSSLFLPDIQRYGLGGRNPVEDMQLMDLVIELKQVYIRDLYPEKRDPILEHFLSKTCPDQEVCWDYKHVYLTTSKFTAYHYATNNPYGSELLSNIVQLYEYIKSHAKDFSLQNELHRKLINKLLSTRTTDIRPVILEVRDMNISILQLSHMDVKKALIQLEALYTSFGEMTIDVNHLDFMMDYGAVISEKSIRIYDGLSEINTLCTKS